MPPIHRVIALLAMPVLLWAQTGQATEQLSAPIMPLASRSLLLDVAIAGDRLVVAGEHGNILFSDDNGRHWQQAQVPTIQMLTGIDFADKDNGWAVGHDGLILVSDDGGERWRIQRDGLAVQRQTNLELREVAHQQLETLEQQLDMADDESRAALELELEDAQFDMEDAELALKEAVFTSPFMDVWFQDADRGWAVGAFGTFVATEDGGRHWSGQQQKLDNPDEFHLNTVTGDDKGRIFIAGEGGVMFRSMDSGNSWETLEPFYAGSWFGTVYDGQHDVLLVFGLRGNLYRSTDFGTTWNEVNTDNNITLAGGNSSEQGEILLVGGVGTILLSTDGGLSFHHTLLEDRLSLSSGIRRDGALVLVGQGGVRVIKDNN